MQHRYRCGGGEWEDVDEAIPLERTPCHFGGDRPWFLCPRCSRRSGKLYGAGKYFLCRRCYDLAYESQREKQWDRARRRALKIRRRLGGEANFVARFPPKPKGLHWRTYDRLCRKTQVAELESLAGVSAFMDRMARKLL